MDRKSRQNGCTDRGEMEEKITGSYRRKRGGKQKSERDSRKG